MVTYGASCHEFVHEQDHLYSKYGQLCRLCTPVALYFWWEKPSATDRAHEVVAEMGWDERPGTLDGGCNGVRRIKSPFKE